MRDEAALIDLLERLEIPTDGIDTELLGTLALADADPENRILFRHLSTDPRVQQRFKLTVFAGAALLASCADGASDKRLYEMTSRHINHYAQNIWTRNILKVLVEEGFFERPAQRGTSSKLRPLPKCFVYVFAANQIRSYCSNRFLDAWATAGLPNPTEIEGYSDLMTALEVEVIPVEVLTAEEPLKGIATFLDARDERDAARKRNPKKGQQAKAAKKKHSDGACETN